jgi:DNA-binding MarR family transcriptional regulator
MHFGRADYPAVSAFPDLIEANPMMQAPADASVARLAQDVFDLITRLGVTSARGRRLPGDLKDAEYLTLAYLAENGPKIVGEIQRELHVLPAQMSRIIRSLEDREGPCIACQINPKDKRKVNVTLTSDGRKLLEEFREQRLPFLMDMLTQLSDDEQEVLGGLIERLRELTHRRIRD